MSLRAGRGQVPGGWGGEWAFVGQSLCPCPSPQGSHSGFKPPSSSPRKEVSCLSKQALDRQVGSEPQRAKGSEQKWSGGLPTPRLRNRGRRIQSNAHRVTWLGGSPWLAPPITGEAAGTWVLAPCPGWGLCGRVSTAGAGAPGASGVALKALLAAACSEGSCMPTGGTSTLFHQPHGGAGGRGGHCGRSGGLSAHC